MIILSCSLLSSPATGHFNQGLLTFETNEQSAEMLKYLWSFSTNAQTKIRSYEQAAAADYTIHTKSDIVAVLPTGCGKRLPFFLYAEKHRGCANSVSAV